MYHRDTRPLLDHYRKQGVVREVNGIGGIEDVTRSVLAALGRS